MARDDERPGGDGRYRREPGEDRYRKEPGEGPAAAEETAKPWRRWWRKRAADSASDAASSSSDSSTSAGKGWGCGVAFLLVFMLFGLGVAVPFFLLPVWRTFEAGTWDGVPCTVERAWVESHAGDDGSTYSIGVVYRYEAGGREYAGDRYDFFLGSTSARAGKEEIVEGLPPGTRTTCWVDPDDPTSAVLSRELRGDFAFGLLVLPFVLFPLLALVGLVGARVKGRRGGRRRESRRADARRSRGRDAAAALKTGWLEPTKSPLGNLATTSGVALLWNSIVGPIAYLTYRNWGDDDSGCIAIFLVPFALIGLLLLAGVPYNFLALFNPRPRIALDRRRVAPGETLEVRWRLRGLAGRVRRLKVELVATETVTTSGSKGSTTREEVLVTLPVADTRERSEIGEGSGTVDVLPDARETSGKVRWEIKLHGEITLWPDVMATFPLEVRGRGLEPDEPGSTAGGFFWRKAT